MRHGTKSVYVISLDSLCRAAMPGVPRGNAWADFLSFFLCSATKKGHQNRHSAARSSMRVRRSSCLKFQLSILGPPHNARRVAYATSWHSPRSSQEGNQGDTPWDPASRRLFESRQDFLSRQAPHLGRMSARPRWVRFGKTFCFLCLPLVVAKVEAQH